MESSKSSGLDKEVKEKSKKGEDCTSGGGISPARSQLARHCRVCCRTFALTPNDDVSYSENASCKVVHTRRLKVH